MRKIKRLGILLVLLGGTLPIFTIAPVSAYSENGDYTAAYVEVAPDGSYVDEGQGYRENGDYKAAYVEWVDTEDGLS